MITSVTYESDDQTRSATVELLRKLDQWQLSLFKEGQDGTAACVELWTFTYRSLADEVAVRWVESGVMPLLDGQPVTSAAGVTE